MTSLPSLVPGPDQLVGPVSTLLGLTCSPPPSTPSNGRPASTAGVAELARTIRVLLGASTAGLLKPEDDHFLLGLVEAYRMLLGLPDTKAAAVEAAQHAWAWAAAQQQVAGKEGTR